MAQAVVYRPEMDGLRGVACLIVLIGHTVSFHAPFSSDYLRGIPKIGVWLFFVLSAFLLTLRLLDSRSLIHAIPQYMYARFLRIVPIFVISVGFYLAYGTLGINSPRDAIEVLTFQKGAGHLWTVPVELGFYIALPIIILLARTVRKQANSTVAAVLVLFLGISCAVAYPPSVAPENAIFTAWYGFAFCMGIAAAFVTPHPMTDRLSAQLITVALTLVVVFTIAMKSGIFGEPKDILLDKHYLFAPLFGLVALGLHSCRGKWKRILSNRLLVSVGEASFSIYIFHWAIFMSMGSLPGFLAIPASLAVSYVAGRLCYRMLELPLYGLRKKTPSARLA